MATGKFSYETGKYTFTVSYYYDNTTFKITEVKTKCKVGGWAAWAQMPGFYFYILKGTSPVKYSWQTQYSGQNAKNHISSHGGTYKNYVGNSPSAYLSNTKGGVKTWSASAIKGLSMKISGSSVNIVVGSFIINTTNTISNVAYGYKKLTLSLYTKPTNFEPSIYSVTNTSITVKATWTNGSKASKAIFTLGSTSKTISTSGGTVTFTGLTGNTYYSISTYLTDGKNYGATSKGATTTLSPVNSLVVTNATTTSISVKASSPNGTGNSLGYQYRYKLKSAASYGAWSSTYAPGAIFTINGLVQNNIYNIQAKVVRTINSTLQENSNYYTVERWTSPQVNLELKLLEGSEHNTIVATASSIGSSSQLKYIFRLDGNQYDINDYNKNLPNPREFTGLKGYSTHTISVKAKNMVSGLESAEVSKSITTWYDPIYSLSTVLVNSWYWLLEIKAAFDYQGGPENIRFYQFSILADQNDYPYRKNKLLRSIDWNKIDNTQYISLESLGLSSTEVSTIKLSDNSTEEQRQAWRNANVAMSKSDKYIILKAYGTLPTIDIQVYFKTNITNTSTDNYYKRGSEIPDATDNLQYNRNYTCRVKLTDNYYRTYTATAIFKTLDARVFYLLSHTDNEYQDSGLVESKLIRPDKTMDWVTPNMLNVIQPNGNIINMNMVINGDPRTEFK